MEKKLQLQENVDGAKELRKTLTLSTEKIK